MMMSARYDTWTHGVAAVLESPELAKLVMHRGDLGTVVEQEAGTSAWFHIPFATPTVQADDRTIYIREFRLFAKVNDNAKVDRIHLRKCTELIYSKDVSYVGTTIDELFNCTDTLTNRGEFIGAGITLCVHVQFLSGDPRGRVEFYGAGARFS
jgi:hypothetical protein